MMMKLQWLDKYCQEHKCDIVDALHAWDEMQSEIARDVENWEEFTEKEQYADYERECRELRTPPLSFEEWQKN